MYSKEFLRVCDCFPFIRFSRSFFSKKVSSKDTKGLGDRRLTKKEKREEEEEAEAVKEGSQTPQKIKLSEGDSPVFKQERKRRRVLIDSDTEELGSG